MRILIFLTFFLISLGQVNAQKIKAKKGIISVDKKEFLKYDDEFDNISLLTLNGDEFAIIKEYSFEKPRKKNPNNPNDWKYGDTTTVRYYLISFTNFDLEFETDLKLKKVYSAFYKYKLIENGNVSKQNAKRIGAKISKEISGDRPIIILSN